MLSLSLKLNHYNRTDNEMIFTCTHVTDMDDDICYVDCDEDGYLSFMCGRNEHNVEDGKILSLKQILAMDNTLKQIINIPVNHYAVRKDKTERWNAYTL